MKFSYEEKNFDEKPISNDRIFNSGWNSKLKTKLQMNSAKSAHFKIYVKNLTTI